MWDTPEQARVWFARKRVEAHLWLLINERWSERRTVSASLCLYQFLLKDMDGR